MGTRILRPDMMEARLVYSNNIKLVLPNSSVANGVLVQKEEVVQEMRVWFNDSDQGRRKAELCDVGGESVLIFKSTSQMRKYSSKKRERVCGETPDYCRGSFVPPRE